MPARNLPNGRSVGISLESAGLFALAIAGLYLGQGILIPLVLAVLVAFALNPVVERLRRAHLPHMVAVIVTVSLVTLISLAVAYLIATQLLKLASDLPQYQETIAQKLRGLQGGSEDSPLGRLAKAVEELGRQVSPAANNPTTNPIPVTITNVPPSPFEGLSGLFGSILGPLATAALVIIFSIFLLLERVDLRDRFLKLVSRGDLRTSTIIIDESAGRVSRYLLIQLAVNFGFGAVFGAGMFVLGVPNAILWGLLAIVFRYIPFIGTLVAVLLPAALAFAVDPGWAMLVGVVALYGALELVTTNAIEPRLYGSSTGISALAVLVAAIFWATLWGTVGLVLATPITVCLVVLGRYVPQLAFLETLLGSEPVLLPEERLYQRLLAGNDGEALELAERELTAGQPAEFFDRVALPALKLAEADLELDGSDLPRRRTVAETITSVLDDIDIPLEAEEQDQDGVTAVVIGGRTELDAAAASMLALTLRSARVVTRQLPPVTLTREGIAQLSIGSAKVVCLCYLGDSPQPYLRSAASRLRRKNTEVKVVACLFGHDSPEVEPSTLNADAIARTVSEAVLLATQWTSPPLTSPSSVAIDADKEDEATIGSFRQAALAGDWAALRTKDIAERFGAALAIAEFRSPSKLSGSPEPTDLTDRVLKSPEPVAITDISLEKDHVDSAAMVANGFRSFIGVPLVLDGQVVGALSLFDVSPRDFSESAAPLVEEAQKLVASLAVRVEESFRAQGIKQGSP